MTKTYYRLSNGTIVKTYAEAIASGCKYTMCYEPIEELGVKTTNEARAKRIEGIRKNPDIKKLV